MNMKIKETTWFDFVRQLDTATLRSLQLLLTSIEEQIGDPLLMAARMEHIPTGFLLAPKIYTKMVQALEQLGIIGIYDDSEVINFMNGHYGNDFYLYLINANSYQELMKATHEVVKDRALSSMGIQQPHKKIIKLVLDDEGNLFREPRESYTYPIEQHSNRHKMVRLLCASGSYIQTNIIARDISAQASHNNPVSTSTIHSEVRKINANAKKYLQIEGKLIEGRKNSGYRINPLFVVDFADTSM